MHMLSSDIFRCSVCHDENIINIPKHYERNVLCTVGVMLRDDNEKWIWKMCSCYARVQNLKNFQYVTKLDFPNCHLVARYLLCKYKIYYVVDGNLFRVILSVYQLILHKLLVFHQGI